MPVKSGYETHVTLHVNPQRGDKKFYWRLKVEKWIKKIYHDNRSREKNIRKIMDHLFCPITRLMFRDPVIVVDSGHTYESDAIIQHFNKNGFFDPLTRNRIKSNPTVVPNYVARKGVQDWLDSNPDLIPEGWPDREVPQCRRIFFDPFSAKNIWKHRLSQILLLLLVRFAK